jgi:hypothetical protein
MSTKPDSGKSARGARKRLKRSADRVELGAESCAYMRHGSSSSQGDESDNQGVLDHVLSVFVPSEFVELDTKLEKQGVHFVLLPSLNFPANGGFLSSVELGCQSSRFRTATENHFVSRAVQEKQRFKKHGRVRCGKVLPCELSQ